MSNRIRSLLFGDSMKARAIRGTALSVIGFGSSQFIRLVSNLLLTRILFPEALGLMALVQVLQLGLEMFSDLAIGTSIIQSKRGNDPTFLNTAWTLQILRGILLWLAACALAAPVAHFYDQEMLLEIIPFVGLGVLITGFSSPRIFLSYRHLTLGRLTFLEIGSQLLGIIFMILLALWLRSVWALVIGTIITQVIRTSLSHIFLKGSRNRIEWEKSAFMEMFHFGKYVFVATIAGFFVNYGDRLVLGKFVQLEDLAIFTIALMLASVPQMLNDHLVERVLLPLYRNLPPSKSNANRKKIKRAKLLMIAGLLCIVAMLALSGELIITFLYDSRYHAAGPFLVLISLSIMPRVIFGGYEKILLANGNSRDFTILKTVTAILKIAVLLAFVSNYGMIGVIVTPVAVEFLMYPFLVYFIRPYRGWYPLLDIGFLIVAVLITIGALRHSSAAFSLLLEMNIFSFG